MGRHPTPKQAAALRYLADNPAAAPSRLPVAAGVAGGFHNEQDFIDRLVRNGWVEVTVTLTSEGRAEIAALDEDEYPPEVAAHLAAAMAGDPCNCRGPGKGCLRR